MKPLTTHEEFCLKNAAHFVAARGRTPATRTREQFATLPEAQAFGAAIGDGRTMIYAVTTIGHFRTSAPDQWTPRARNRSCVTRPRDSMASRIVLLMVLAGRNLSEFTMSA